MESTNLVSQQPALFCTSFILFVAFCLCLSLSHYFSVQQTALHWSAFYNRPEHVRLLIKHDSNIGIPDSEGKIPLHWAAHSQEPSATQTVRCILVHTIVHTHTHIHTHTHTQSNKFDINILHPHLSVCMSFFLCRVCVIM